MEYLYLFNYPPEEVELYALELKYLFKEEVKDRVLITTKDVPCNTSIFVKGKIEIMASSSCIEELYKMAEQLKLDFSTFKVIYLKNNTTHAPYQDTLLWCNTLSKLIQGKNVMREQDVTLAITKYESMYYFGIYHHGVPDWKHHHNKPYTFSNALDLRLARTIINIAGQQNFNTTIVDPCCGMATVVLEGLRLGYTVRGFDISREISFKARKNVIHYGYDGEVIQRGDINELKDFFDVVIIDIPYNLFGPITYEEQCNIIQSARRIGKVFILISYDEMDKELVQAGFEIMDVCRVKKTMFTKFERKVYVCK